MTHEDQLLGRIMNTLIARHATDAVRVTTNNNTLTMGTDAAGTITALRTYLFLERAMVELDGINPKVADAIRDRMDTIWHELTESERARLDDRTEGLWSACAETGLGHERTTVAWRESELDALTSLAIALGLDADGNDPRAEVERLLMDAKDASDRLSDVCAELDGTIAELDALRLAARAIFEASTAPVPQMDADKGERERRMVRFAEAMVALRELAFKETT